MQGVGEGPQAHRAGAGHDREVAALLDAHVVLVDAHVRVVGGMEGTDRAAHGLGERGLVVRLALVHEEATAVEDLVREDAVGGVTAAELVGVAGRVHGALVVERGLDGELLAGLVLVGVLGAHLDDVARKLVPGDGGMVGDIGVDPLVGSAEGRHLIGGHADGVRDHLHENLVLFDLGKLELVDPDVVRRVQSCRPCLHLVPPCLRGLVPRFCFNN